MADMATEAKTARRRRNWRHSENRAATKYVAKRVTQADHEALTKYAEAHGVKVAEMLTPAVNDLIARARDYCGQLDELPASAKAS